MDVLIWVKPKGEFGNRCPRPPKTSSGVSLLPIQTKSRSREDTADAVHNSVETRSSPDRRSAFYRGSFSTNPLRSRNGWSAGTILMTCVSQSFVIVWCGRNRTPIADQR